VDRARQFFEETAGMHHVNPEGLFGIAGIGYAKLLVRTREWETAKRLSKNALDYAERWERIEDIAWCNVTLAEVAALRGNSMMPENT
jgi:hypothetical protein